MEGSERLPNLAKRDGAQRVYVVTEETPYEHWIHELAKAEENDV